MCLRSYKTAIILERNKVNPFLKTTMSKEEEMADPLLKEFKKAHRLVESKYKK